MELPVHLTRVKIVWTSVTNKDNSQFIHEYIKS